jgi:methyl-accepting chemotaxis protein
MTTWTFGQKVGAGFLVTVMLTLALGVLGIWSLRSVVEAKDRVLTVDAQSLVNAQRVAVAIDRGTSSIRGYFLVPTQRRLDDLREERGKITPILATLRSAVDDAEGLRLLDQVDAQRTAYDEAADALIALRQTDASMDVIAERFDKEVAPKRVRLLEGMDAFIAHATEILVAEQQAATATATRATRWMVGITTLIVAASLLIAMFLAGTLGRQIGAAVGHVQSSSAELQAAANQQATSTKEQATAMSEITTTITELLATSRQIAESAQRVAQIANQTATSARTGNVTVARADESITAIRRQVELIVGHMVDLGRKSQQIGGVLDIVSELAEQTNILAINASIEAAGAGESGRRFGVVAEEIRKLADRVTGSTKEIKILIDDVRSSANASIMTTETGSKAVDTGAKLFADVAAAFEQIGALVGTTTEAAREIELSTKQQATAVEQVNFAITNVAQATKETEASTTQTLQTSMQLSSLSRDLIRLVRQDGVAERAA